MPRCLPSVILAVLLLGLMAVWWWREEWRPSRPLQLQTILLKESQDPLIHRAPLAPHTGTIKARHTPTFSNGQSLVKIELSAEWHGSGSYETVHISHKKKRKWNVITLLL